MVFEQELALHGDDAVLHAQLAVILFMLLGGLH